MKRCNGLAAPCAAFAVVVLVPSADGRVTRDEARGSGARACEDGGGAIRAAAVMHAP